MSLASFQESFLATLHDQEKAAQLPSFEAAGSLSNAKAVTVYQRAYRVRLIETLRSHFPAVWRTLGDEEFRTLSTAYINSNPPTGYSLDQFGDQFPSFLAQWESGEAGPLLAELAEFEWMFSKLFHEPYISAVDPTFFAQQAATGNIQIGCAPSLRIHQSDHSVYKLWTQRESGKIGALDEYRTPESLILVKQQTGIVAIEMPYQDALFLKEISEQQDFLLAVENSSQYFNIDPEIIERTIGAALSLGCFVSVGIAG